MQSNEWTGKYSFGGQSLHKISAQPNPYEEAASIISRTLAPFDDDNEIPVMGFGDVTTRDKSCFSFFAENRPAHGLDEAVARYRQIAPLVSPCTVNRAWPLKGLSDDIWALRPESFFILKHLKLGCLDSMLTGPVSACW